MRISVSLLILCAAITGCNTSIDPANVDSIVVSSNPTAAAIRLNGEPVGRTPTTIKVDRTKNYELQVGKGGYLTEVSELKPRLITTSEGIEFGFPSAVRVNLTKIPADGEAGVPVSDNPEFKRLSKKAIGEDAAAKESLKSDIAATKEAATKIQASSPSARPPRRLASPTSPRPSPTPKPPRATMAPPPNSPKPNSPSSRPPLKPPPLAPWPRKT